ncbi:hypothetical protein NL526_27715, partial [Klebsiella pneumoniae]|nr:hypothetical protein [Klebsiella pneumoniae]
DIACCRAAAGRRRLRSPSEDPGLLAIAFASLLVGATGLMLCISGCAVALLPVRWAAAGRAVAWSGAAALAVSGCGVAAVALAAV